MRNLGAILTVLGGIGLVYALRIDITVPVAGLSSSDRVPNVGLMDQRHTVLIVSGLAILGGFIFTGAAGVASQVAKAIGNESGDRPRGAAPAIAEPRTATGVHDSYGTGGAKIALVIGVGLAAFVLAAWFVTHM